VKRGKRRQGRGGNLKREWGSTLKVCMYVYVEYYMFIIIDCSTVYLPPMVPPQTRERVDFARLEQ
jgi:hypothetical protein